MAALADAPGALLFLGRLEIFNIIDEQLAAAASHLVPAGTPVAVRPVL